MMQPLFEKYRPRTWADVIGQEKIGRRIDVLRRRGLGGRAYWITGASGTGRPQQKQGRWDGSQDRHRETDQGASARR